MEQRTALAFDQLKDKLSSAPVLRLPDPTLEFTVTADASDFAIGAVLSQDDGTGPRPVAYESRKLRPAEINYATHEKELLAIVHALRIWRHYLYGTHFKIVTDHNPLRYFDTQNTLTRRQARWMELMQEYDYEILYQPGKQNVVADTLSRRPDLHTCAIATVSVASDLLDRIKQGYHDDNNFQELHQLLSTAGTSVPAKLDTKAKRFQLRDGLLYYVAGTLSRLCIPNAPGLRLQLLQECHDPPTAGHLGFDKTYELMHRMFYWPRMDKSVRNFVSTCDVCQRIKDSTTAPTGLLQPLPVPTTRFEQVSLDLITQLPKTKLGHDAIVVFVDRLSKLAYFCPTTSNVDAPGVASLFFGTVWRHHGLPRVLVSDRDPRFISKFWQSLFKLCGTNFNISTAYHPETDGQTERTNRTLEQMLRAYVCHKQNDWDRVLYAVEFAYNNSEQASTGFTPFKIATGQSPITPASFLNIAASSSPVQSTEEFLRQVQNAVKIATDNMTLAQDYQAEYANRSRRDDEFKVNDIVLLSSDHINTAYGSQQPSKKLKHRWLGPYRIEQAISKVAYKLELPPSMKVHPVFHASVLKRYKETPPEFSERQKPPPPPPVVINDNEEYEVEQILDKRIVNRGRNQTPQYLVKWVGYPEHDATWEPASYLAHSQELVEEFESGTVDVAS